MFHNCRCIIQKGYREFNIQIVYVSCTFVHKMGDSVFEETDPDDVLFPKEIYRIDNETNSLKIYLPFADKEELRLEQDKNELVVGVKNESRKFPVPVEFAEKEIVGAKFEDGYLNIRF